MAQPWFYSLLACPDCKGDLQMASANELRCASCTFSAPVSTPINLFPVRPKPVSLSFKPFTDPDPNTTLSELDLSAPPKIYTGPMIPPHDEAPAMLFSQIMSSKSTSPRVVLDLGAGGGKKECFDFLGCKYVGLDISGKSDIAGDGHYLPFKNGQFDVVFSYCVLEHLYNPFMVLSEVRRVLKPDGIFVGMGGQGEPFHGSFFNHTAWGLLAVADATGLKVTRIWGHWDTLRTLADMGSYPKIIRVLLSFLNILYERVPLLAPRRMMTLTQKQRELSRLHQAGSICFCMQRDNKMPAAA